MEEILRFNGALNLSDTNVPEGDYPDARNIVIGEDDQGNGGAFKKMRSIEAFADISEFGDTIASTITDEGEQYFLCKSDAIKVVSMPTLLVEDNPIGALVTQSNGARGYVISPDTTPGSPTSLTLRILQTSTTNFTGGLSLVMPEGTRSVVSATVGAAISCAFIVKVATDAEITPVVAYELSETPTIDPDLKLVGDVLVWNYLFDGTPLSFYSLRPFAFASDETYAFDVYTYDDLTLIKKPPYWDGVIDDYLLESDTATPSYVFRENWYALAMRYVYDSGEVSVLSQARTIPPTPDADYDTLRINLSDIPKNVIKAELYASLNRGSFRRSATIGVSFPDYLFPDGGTVSTQFNFKGELNESLSSSEAFKISDSVPISSKAIEVTKNRVFLGNLTDDLTPGGSATVTVTENVFGDDFASSGAENSEETPYFYGSPTGIVSSFSVEHLTSDSLYRIGLVFMDRFFRTRGVLKESIKPFRTGSLDLATAIKQVTISISDVPDWAEICQVVMTRNLTKDFSIESYANSIFFELEDGDGVIYYSNFAPEGVSVRSIVIDPNISYSFQQGDRVNLVLDDGTIGQVAVKSSINNLIFCDHIEGFRRPKLGGDQNYFEVFSPANQTSEDINLFYETGLFADITVASTTYTQNSSPLGKRLYDQYMEKKRFRAPIYSKAIDYDTAYGYYLSDDEFKLGLPVSLKGALIYANADIEDVVVSTNTFSFDGMHTNSHELLVSNVYWVEHTTHGYSVGDVVDIEPAGAVYDKQEIISVIDANNYLAAVTNRILTVSSNTGFASGDEVVISGDAGSFSCKVAAITGGTTIYICGALVKDIVDTSGFDSITNGVNTTTISSVSVYTGADYLASLRTIFSTEKVYVCSVNNSPGTDVFQLPYDPTNELTGNYEFQSSFLLTGVSLPAKSGVAKIFYDIETIADEDNTDDITVNLSVRGNDTDSLTPLGTLSAGESGRYSGVVSVELSPNRQMAYGINQSCSGTQYFTVTKGSYLYAVLEEDVTQGTLQSERADAWGISRSPNQRANDDFTWDRPYGRPLIEDSELPVKQFGTKIRWGARFIEDSQINPISSFNSFDQDFVSQESGDITALVRTSKLNSVGSVLLALCQREANSIYVGERMVTNNDGSTSLAVSDSVIGSIQPLQGSHGTNHKKSITRDQDGGVVYWDDFNRDMIRYSREGLVPISDDRVKPYFQSKSGEFVSFYDKFHDLYFFTKTGSTEAVSFQQGLGWVSYHDFTFDLGGEQFNERSYPVKDGIVYKTLGTTFGEYFGEAQESYIVLTKFMSQNFEPMYLRLRGDLVDFDTYEVKSIDILLSNDNDQETSLDGDFFVIDGSCIYSDIYRDENSVGGLSNGIPLNGSSIRIKVTLGSSTDESQPVKEVYLGMEAVNY